MFGMARPYYASVPDFSLKNKTPSHDTWPLYAGPLARSPFLSEAFFHVSDLNNFHFFLILLMAPASINDLQV